MLSSKYIRLCLVTGLLATIGCQQKAEQPNTKPDSPKGRVVEPVQSLQFLNTEGVPVSTLQIAIVDEPTERNQGLMDVNSMPMDHGMLFIFEREEPLSFWMANTPLPLDIMYINSDSVIVRIYSNTTPFSEKSLPSQDPAIFVVETNGGYATQFDIREGMRVRF
ncbi:MAG: DUF192 domain-containing protein [Bacteroidota bacterium]